MGRNREEAVYNSRLYECISRLISGISRLIIWTSRLIGAFSEAELVLFSGACFLFWWSTNMTQFLFNKGFVSKD